MTSALLPLTDAKQGLVPWPGQEPPAWRGSQPRPAVRPAAQQGSRTPSVKRRLVLVTTERPSRPAQVTSGGVRVTRRGRLTVLLAALVLASSAMLAVAGVGRSPSHAEVTSRTAGASAPSPQQLIIQPGDSLWTVARRIAPDRDPRTVVRHIRLLNQLSDATVYVGQSLLLPFDA